MRIKACIAALCSTSAVILAACGGSDDPPTDPAPAAPAVTLTYGIKQLKFSWSAVSGATHYRLLERPDATGSFTQVGADLTTISVNHDIALHRRVNAAYRIEACNSIGCTASQEIGLAANLVPAIGYFKASNTGAQHLFGVAIALSSDGATLAVGASEENSGAMGINGNQGDTSAGNAGAVYVFVKGTGSMWTQHAYIKASDTTAGDEFGGAIALSADGSWLAVGARREGSNATGINGNQANNSAPSSGAVYVFVRTGPAWSQQAYIKASNTETIDLFGSAVALSADATTLAIGAFGESSNATGVNGNQANNSLPFAGAAYVFTRSGDTWSQQAYLKSSNPSDEHYFGQQLALSADGHTLAVGAYGERSSATGINGNQADFSAGDSGAVYVFARAAAAWSQQAYIKASNTGAKDEFGASVALSRDGNTLAVGAPKEDSSATAIGGNESDNSTNGAGAVYVFVRTAGVWSQQAYVKAANTYSGFFGRSVALSADGTTLAVGADYEGSKAPGVNGDSQDVSLDGAGAVFVFTRSAGVWSQKAYLKASNPGEDDHFGYSVALSGDGATLAVGAVHEDGAALGISGDPSSNAATNSGAVYLY